MRLKIGGYIENEMEKKGVNKKELYSRLKETFHVDDEYVKYKGFTSRFYGKMYAEDLIEIAYLLGIDLNKMKDELINDYKGKSLLKVKDALSKSKYANCDENGYSRWSCLEDGYIYLIWFKPINNNNELDIKVELYNIKKDKISDISYLNYLAIKNIDREWDNKSFEERMHSVKNLNKNFHEKIYIY